MTKHALLSPSSASRWTRCPGSVALSRDLPDEGSTYADDGTATHELAAMVLQSGGSADAYLGRMIAVNGKQYEVDADRAARVQTYADYVRSLPGELLVEQRLPIAAITGEPNAAGTSDAVVLGADELAIVDLKDGRGVRVDAVENEQLAIYAKAALDEYGFLGFERVRMVIVQPKLNHISEWDMLVEDLERFVAMISKAAKTCRLADEHRANWIGGPDYSYLVPGEKQCKFCKAKANCPAAAAKVRADLEATFTDMVETADTVIAEVESVADDILASKFAAVPFIEDWCRAVAAEAERRMFAGHNLPGFKIVAGKKGSRQWASKDEAEQLLKAMRLRTEQMYELSLITPTTAEKLAKAGDIGPRQWPKLQTLITQNDGKPTVVPESDKRQAIQVGPRADVFSDLVTA